MILAMGAAQPAAHDLVAMATTVPAFAIPVLLSPGLRVLAFVWGLVWGSFANVVIHRVPLGLSIVRPRSRCPRCETPIASLDNVPVLSYLLLRGKCRACKAPVSLRYPTVELLAGMLSFALYMRHVFVPLVAGADASPWAWLLWFTFGLALLVVTYIDLDYWIIPDVIVLPLTGVAVAAAVLVPDVLGVGAFEAIMAALAGFALFAGIRFVYLRWRGIEALGLGDAKLLLMVGAFTGPTGLVWTIGAGAVQGLLVSIPMLLAGRRIANRELADVHGDDPELGEDDPDRVLGQRVPFGPFLALAAIEFMLLRGPIEDLAGALL